MQSLKAWQTGFVSATGEPVLILDLHDGTHMEIMLPAQAAQEMGDALSRAGQKAARPSTHKPS